MYISMKNPKKELKMINWEPHYKHIKRMLEWEMTPMEICKHFRLRFRMNISLSNMMYAIERAKEQ